MDKIISYFKQYPYFGILILVAAIGYWPLFFYEAKWDNIDQFFPFRFFIDYSFKEGQIPLWNPFLNLGYPQYADPQGGVWYPFTWLFSLVGYSFFSFNIELWLHYVIAGWGMFILGRALGIEAWPSLALGLLYTFSGFMVGTAQILPFIIGATWLPYIMAAFLKLYRRPGWSDGLMLILVTALTILGGYPAYMIITFYLFVLFFAFYFWMHRKSRTMCVKGVYLGLGLSVGILWLCGGYFWALLECFPYISRSEVLPYNWIFYFTSFTFQCSLSFLFPFATALRNDFFNSDLSMLNGYVGLLTWPIIIFYSLHAKGKLKYGLWAMIIFLFLASTGNQTPVRHWLYQFVPGFEMFRHPSIFRIYFMLGLLVLFGLGLQEVWKRNLWQKLLPYYAGLALVLVLSILLTHFPGYTQFKPLLSDLLNHVEGPDHGIKSHIYFQAIIGLVLVSSLLFWLKSASVRIKGLGLITFIAIDLCLATQLNIFTTINNNKKLKECQISLDQNQIQFAFPSSDPNQGLVSTNFADPLIEGCWRNLSIFQKKVAYDGYNPFMLTNFNVLEASPIFKATIQNPLVFLSADLRDIATPDTLQIRILQMQKSTLKELFKNTYTHRPSDHIKSLKLKPNSIRIQYSSEGPQFLALSQNHHPNWAVYIDGKQSQIQRFNHSLMSVAVPAGKHEVLFIFSSFATVLWWFSLLGFLVFGINLLILKRKAQGQ